MYHGSGAEKVILGSSKGAIEVEAVNLNKIRGKLSNLQRLREVSLDNEGVFASDPPGEIQRTCPGQFTNITEVISPYWCTTSILVTGPKETCH